MDNFKIFEVSPEDLNEEDLDAAIETLRNERFPKIFEGEKKRTLNKKGNKVEEQKKLLDEINSWED